MIHIIIGTRAQIIKMAPIMSELKKRGIDYNFIFLAQHNETMYEIMEQFKIKRPDIIIGERSKDITNVKDMIFWSIRVLAYALLNNKKIFRNDTNGVVLIHGDAPPLFLGGLMAKFQSGLKTAQVEAGLRSFNYFKPFPEELIRVLSAKLNLIDIFFCQDEKAVQNVSKYNKLTHCTHHNTIFDSINLADSLYPNQNHSKTIKPFAIISLHRFETISKKNRLELVLKEVQKISKKISILFILHPSTREALIKKGLYSSLNNDPNCSLLPRQSFFKFNSLLKNAEFIVTDGGSNQEESYYMGKPCLLLRTETERMEGLGHNVVISNFDSAVIDNFLCYYKLYQKEPISKTISPSQIIIDHLKEFT